MFKNLSKFNEQNFIHFVTSKTFQNYPYFRDEKYCLILLEELDFYRRKFNFKILGYVIMPDHFHCLIWWDVGQNSRLTISKIIQGIKGHAAKSIIESLGKPSSGSKSLTGRLEPQLQPLRCEQRLASTRGQRLASTRGAFTHRTSTHRRGLKYQIWQKGFYDFNIYTEQKFQEKLNYIHKNPIVAGICGNYENYQWSSYRQIMGIDKNQVLKVEYLEI